MADGYYGFTPNRKIGKSVMGLEYQRSEIESRNAASNQKKNAAFNVLKAAGLTGEMDLFMNTITVFYVDHQPDDEKVKSSVASAAEILYGAGSYDKIQIMPLSDRGKYFEMKNIDLD